MKVNLLVLELLLNIFHLDRLRQKGVKPLIKLLNNLGGWPIVQRNWDKNTFNLEKLMADLKLYNNDILITEWIGPDIVNSKNYIIQVTVSQCSC